MNCLLTGANVKFLARTVNLFSRIGDELYLEATPTGLILKTLNSMKTAYVAANFPIRFFINFKQGPNDDVFEENHCKVSIKPCLKIFKSLAQIQTCKIWLVLDKSKIVFQFKCKSDIVKTHTISLLEHEHINSVRLPKEYPNKMVGGYKLFNKILSHFHSSIDEITFDISNEKILITNYIENPAKDKTSMRSRCVLKHTDFKLYDVEFESRLTFCFREFKAMACFSELNKLEVEINFDSEGTPLMIHLEKDGILHLNLIMGTLRPKSHSRKNSHRNNDGVTSRINTTSSTTVSSCISKNASRIADQNANKSLDDNNLFNFDVNQSRHETADDLRDVTLIDEFDTPMSIGDATSPIPQPSVSSARKSVRGRTSVFDGINVQSREKPNKTQKTLLSEKRRSEQLDDPDSYDIVFEGNTEDTNTDEIEKNAKTPKRLSNHQNQIQSESVFPMQTNDIVPESPEIVEMKKRKIEKIRHIFKKCFESTFDPTKMPGCSQIYAENSDPEDL